MASLKPETGLVVRYRYLWRRQADAGEETGRKARPACVVIPVGSGEEVVLLPLTTQPPGEDRAALQVPETERRRLKLKGDSPTWIIVDEANVDRLPQSFHLEPLSYAPPVFAYGTLSPAFMKVVLSALASIVRERRLKTVQRAR